MRDRALVWVFCFGIVGLLPAASSAQWRPTGGPGRCCFTSLAVSGSYIFAGTYRRGIFRSTDEGLSWESINSGLPFQKGLGLVSVSGAIIFTSGEGGIFRSADSGTSWVDISPALPENAVVKCFEVSDGRLLAGTDGGRIYISADGGATWKETLPHLPSPVLDLAIFESELFVGSGDDIYICRDCERSADVVKLRLPDISSGAYVIGMNPKLIKAGTRLVVSATRGNYLIGRTPEGWAAELLKLPSRESRINGLEESGPNLVVATYEGVFRTADSGANWTEGRLWLPGTGVCCLARYRSSLLAVADDGVFRSMDNGASWRLASSGPTCCESDISSLAVVGSSLLAGAVQNVFRSTDNGANWTHIGVFPLDSEVEGVASCNHGLFAITQRGLYKSTDSGGNWTLFREGTLSNGCLFGRGERLIVSSRYYPAIEISTDGGTSWTGRDAPGYAMITCFYLSGSILFAGTGAQGKSFNPEAVTNSVYLSTDGGLSWKGTQARFSDSVICLAKVGTSLFVSTYRGLYVCIDYARCPKPAKLKIPRRVSIYSLETVGTDLYVGTDKGVFLVRNNGKDWTAVDTGMPDWIKVRSLARLGNNLFAGTDGLGVWRLPLSDLSLIKQ